PRSCARAPRGRRRGAAPGRPNTPSRSQAAPQRVEDARKCAWGGQGARRRVWLWSICRAFVCPPKVVPQTGALQQQRGGTTGGATRLPLPACGERVGVRGPYDEPVEKPLTRRASCVDLAPQPGRGEAAGAPNQTRTRLGHAILPST